MVWSGREVHLCGGRGGGIAVIRADISRAEGPDTIDGQRLAARILQQSVEFSASQVVGGNESARLSISPTRKLPDEQVVAEAEPEPRPTERSTNHHVRDAPRGPPWNCICPQTLSPGRRFQIANLPRGAHR